MSQCSYREAFRQRRFCMAPAHWYVTFTTPDDGKTMRKREGVVRCSHHIATRFLPKGATQITTESLEHRLVASPSRADAAGKPTGGSDA